MKLLITLIAVCTACVLRASVNPNDQITENPFQASFDKAYAQYPLIKKGVLEAVAFTNTRFQHLPPAGPESCLGMPRAIGVMGMVQDGKGFFHPNLLIASTASGYSVQEISTNPEKNILSYASMLYGMLLTRGVSASDPVEDQLKTALAISELPVDNTNTVINFARESFLYSLASFIGNSQYQNLFHFPDYKLDLRAFFGANYEILRSANIKISNHSVSNKQGRRFSNTSIGTGVLSADYPAALWNPAASCNYTTGRTMSISAVTIHDVEGTYAGCISWFQNCSAVVSAHYVVRSSDGQITQMVLESNKAWHVGSENGYTIGIEHEGYQAQTGWYTTAMYQQSALLVADICNSGYGINPKNLAFWPWAATTDYNATSTPVTCTHIKGHQHYPNQTHTDPGPNWDWETYYRLVNSTVPAATVYTTATGNFFDSGGSGGNYSSLERSVWTISPTSATTVTLNFTSFNCTSNYDYLFLYDGNSINAPLIGKYTGTTSPGTITSSGGSITAEFRSACGSTSPGWAASWSINGTAPGPDNIAPTTSVSVPGVWQTANFNASFTESDNTGGSGLFKCFYQVIDLNGTDWRANNTQGFFSDNFSQTAISPEWTASGGTWGINTTNVSLEQSDQTLSNTNLYASLNQSLSNQYLYNWSGMISGTGTNRRAGLHIFCDSAADVNRGHSYFVWFRVDQSKLEFYKTANGGFGTAVANFPMTTVAGQWYDWKIVYDRTLGLIEVFQNNVLIGSYTDPSPIATGTGISFRSGNCDWQVQNFKVYRTRAANTPQTITVGNCPSCMLRYQNQNPATPAGKVKSIVRDSANNFSTIAAQDINVDWTPPSNVYTLNDGTGPDLDTTANGTQLSNNWRSSADPNSGIYLYEYAIGTTSGSTNVVNWTGNLQDTTVTKTGLALVSGTTYYTSVRTTNHAGLVSGIVTSDGILYLGTSTGINNSPALSSRLYAFPNPFSSLTTVAYTLSEAADVHITLIDVLGKQIFTSETGIETPGLHHVGIDAGALGLSSGIYFLRLETSNLTEILKLNVR
ncbi:MAG: N-acetylmuramoyl-L-alanine amidase [Bacteroidia bacterium]